MTDQTASAIATAVSRVSTGLASGRLRTRLCQFCGGFTGVCACSGRLRENRVKAGYVPPPREIPPPVPVKPSYDPLPGEMVLQWLTRKRGNNA